MTTEHVDVSLDTPYQRRGIMRGTDPVSAFAPAESPTQPRPPAPRPAAEDEETVTSGFTTHLSRAVVFRIDPRDQFTSEVTERARQARTIQHEYRSRIETLRSEAVHDGFEINEASEKDFWAFMRLQPVMRKGLLALVDNGNLRAVWKGEHGTHIGLQFLGARRVQYVIFKRRRPGGDVSRVAGSDTLEGVRAQIHAFNLEPLLYE